MRDKFQNEHKYLKRRQQTPTRIFRNNSLRLCGRFNRRTVRPVHLADDFPYYLAVYLPPRPFFLHSTLTRHRVDM